MGSDQMQYDVLTSSPKRYHDTSNIFSDCHTVLIDVDYSMAVKHLTKRD